MTQKPEHTFTIGEYSFEIAFPDHGGRYVTCNDDGEHKYTGSHPTSLSIADIMEHLTAEIYDNE